MFRIIASTFEFLLNSKRDVKLFRKWRRRSFFALLWKSHLQQMFEGIFLVSGAQNVLICATKDFGWKKGAFSKTTPGNSGENLDFFIKAFICAPLAMNYDNTFSKFVFGKLHCVDLAGTLRFHVPNISTYVYKPIWISKMKCSGTWLFQITRKEVRNLNVLWSFSETKECCSSHWRAEPAADAFFEY